MADYNTNLDPISEAQSGKATTANAFFDAASPATLYGRRASTSSGNTWGYYGGRVTKNDGTTTSISNGTLTLTLSSTNYIVVAKATGVVTVSAATTNWNDTTNYWRVYQVVCGASAPTGWTDYREMGKMTGGGGGTGSAITAKDEGTNLTTALASLNFAGAGVTATTSGNDVTITIPGGGGRETLTADRTYYVRTDGSDSNNGLANTSGGAFLTIQKAVDIIAGTLDTATYTATIQVGDGTYTNAVSLRAHIGNLPYVIQGNASTPANVHVNVTGDGFSSNDNRVVAKIKNLKISSTNIGVTVLSGVVELNGGIEFGSNTSRAINVQYSGYINVTGNMVVSGGGQYFFTAINGGKLRTPNITITTSGSPAFSVAFAYVDNVGHAQATNLTFSGTGATGQRYSATLNGVINTNGGGANYFPGNAAGTTATGGQYS